MNRTSLERPSKRVRQACEPCRRKKAKCPGEQPVCSLCARLRQRCAYAGERRRSLPHATPDGSPSVATTTAADAPEVRISRTLEDRLGSLESKMGKVLDALERNSSRDEQQRTNDLSLRPSTLSGPITSSMISAITPLPTWEKVLAVAELYLLYCESQPLPLFQRDSFLSSLSTRDPEILYAILALSIRFSGEDCQGLNDLASLVSGYTEVARGLVMRRVSEGPVELSTLQCLCLLSLIDFTNGNTHRSSIHSSLAMNLAQCANLGSETHATLSAVVREERRRCFWSICLSKRFHGVEFDSMGFPDGSFPPFPQSPERPHSPFSPSSAADEARSTGMEDQGIIAYVIILSEVFAKTTRYVRRHGRPSSVPPWSSQSEYSKIITLQMDLETRMPYIHRFKPANLSERTAEELQANRGYWGPWFLNQFLYHTNLCLLNHPLLLSLSLRNFRNSIPEIFLQHTSDLISSHTTWIIHFINYFEEKNFIVSDPLLGYSAAVVATIELQLSFTEDKTIRQEKRDRFYRCVKFVETIGQRWPHMAQLADKLQRLEGAVSATYQPEPRAQNKSLLIDLSRFWEILEYSFNRDTGSARRLFGDSLYSEPPTIDTEVSQTSPLPEPTRLNSHSEQSHPGSRMSEYGFQPALPVGSHYAMGSAISPRQPDFFNDELSILATNFFSQGQEFLRGSDNREGIGNF
ncbi:quinic acid utilization activator [Aspergillus lentulus]|uniref:Quinic acid utilization activator n=1 Tax=Aspergillus lentulus TaxID=293939 RepID=A0ABQ0ZRA1_ASPLE|nr:quinic acid utilization activator [Aspergillus lentulus]GFF86838.1 quinic acid utilization activator [Aspergillus lentulus]